MYIYTERWNLVIEVDSEADNFRTMPLKFIPSWSRHYRSKQQTTAPRMFILSEKERRTTERRSEWELEREREREREREKEREREGEREPFVLRSIC